MVLRQVIPLFWMVVRRLLLLLLLRLRRALRLLRPPLLPNLLLLHRSHLRSTFSMTLHQHLLLRQLRHKHLQLQRPLLLLPPPPLLHQSRRRRRNLRLGLARTCSCLHLLLFCYLSPRWDSKGEKRHHVSLCSQTTCSRCAQ